jgi:ubiquinone/menaquinone biosynthesis C-methylase UbiE
VFQVNHESPKWVSEAIYAEAYRVLRPGGHLTILDLDKNNLEILLENPFVAAVYKQTEPYMVSSDSPFLQLQILKPFAL